MKSFKEVEATRRAYHQDAALNSVHRASLMVPELAGAEAEISFVNHFLLKRGYAKVACRVTAVDPAGKRIEARLFPITEPKVYTIPLTGMVSVPVATYLVDFFAADNLFIPFPAVMLNHRGPGFLNTVHAYNRVLNDVFEDDAINATSNPEASIDVLLDGRTDTFAVFTAGPRRCQGELEVELAADGRVHTASIALDVPRLCNQEVSLRQIFPGLQAGTTGFLRLRQPRQELFYGRLLAGRRCDDGAFSANHSYYDSSGVAEYWEDNREAYRLYPFFADLDNVVRMYPIMSPGTLAVAIVAYDRAGRRLAELPAGELESPGPRFLEVDVNRRLAESGVAIGDVCAFAVRAWPVRGKTPTRVNHELVYGGGGLQTSVNVSLANPNVFVPPTKTGLTWGQAPVGGDIESWLGFVGNAPQGAACELAVTLYGEQGELARKTCVLPGGGSVQFNLADALAEAGARSSEQPANVWYIARAARSDLSAYAVTRHRDSRHCSGEHSY